jgi:putative intracellular protease/amidase
MSEPILIVLTSHDRLGDTGHPTGFWYEELATPYRLFDQAGYDIVIASPKGGEPPHDPKSLEQLDELPDDVVWFLANPAAVERLLDSRPIAELDFSAFSAVFIPGGHGAVFDLPGDARLATGLGKAFDAGVPVGAVCHGPGGLVGALRSDGRPLVAGYRVSGFTNGEEAAVGLTGAVPFLLADRLRELGGDYVQGRDFEPFAVRDRGLVTGQNPMSSALVADLVLEALAERRASGRV